MGACCSGQHRTDEAAGTTAQAPAHPAHLSPSPGLQHVQAALGGTPVPGQLLPPLPLDQLVIQDDGLLLPQQLQGFLVLFSQLLHEGGHSSLLASGEQPQALSTCSTSHAPQERGDLLSSWLCPLPGALALR